MEHIKSEVSRRYDELIAKEAAKTKEQAVTAKELTLELEIVRVIDTVMSHKNVLACIFQCKGHSQLKFFSKHIQTLLNNS